MYRFYLHPIGGVYRLTFEDTPGYALPLAASPSNPWHDLRLIRPFCSDLWGLNSQVALNFIWGSLQRSPDPLAVGRGRALVLSKNWK